MVLLNDIDVGGDDAENSWRPVWSVRFWEGVAGAAHEFGVRFLRVVVDFEQDTLRRLREQLEHLRRCHWVLDHKPLVMRFGELVRLAAELENDATFSFERIKHGPHFTTNARVDVAPVLSPKTSSVFCRESWEVPVTL